MQYVQKPLLFFGINLFCARYFIESIKRDLAIEKATFYSHFRYSPESSRILTSMLYPKYVSKIDRQYSEGFKSIFAAFTKKLQLSNSMSSNPTPGAFQAHFWQKSCFSSERYDRTCIQMVANRFPDRSRALRFSGFKSYLYHHQPESLNVDLTRVQW